MLDKILALERVKYCDFGKWADGLTNRLRTALSDFVHAMRRPVVHVRSPRTDKDSIVRSILERDRVKKGLICAITSLEIGRSPTLRRDCATGAIGFRFEPRPQQHWYLYLLDPVFGYCFVRFQTWLPFKTEIYLNGREYLALRMKQERIKFTRADNCFPKIEDMDRAQEILDELVRMKWESQLQRLACSVNPIHDHILSVANHPTYWMQQQLE